MPNLFFYIIGIGIASGILFRSFFDVGLADILLLTLIGFSLGYIWWTLKQNFYSPFFLFSLAILCFTLGVLRFQLSDEGVSPLESAVEERVNLEGVITREPEIREASIHLYVRDSATKEIVLVTTDRFQPFLYGDKVSVTGTLKKPETFETDLGRTFDYPGYLRARGVSYTISFANVEVVAHGEGNWFLEKLFQGKQKFMNSLEQAIPEPESGLGLGVLLGAKRALGESLEEAFRSVGIIHIVVLSGYNIMIVAEAIMRLLSFAFRPRSRMVIGIVAIASFAILVGLSATVIRASIMACLILIARTVGRQYAVMRALMLAGVVMILINPYLLAFDPGFQLSFLATLGLIVLAPIVERHIIHVPTKFGIREFLTATIATQIFILPFLVFLIGTFSVVSVLVNVLVLPIVPIAMLLSFVAGCAGLVSDFLGVIFGFPAYLSLAYIITIAEQFARLPFASFALPPFSFWIVCLAYLGMGVWLSIASKTREIQIETEDHTVLIAYDDWTIEVEKETPVEVRSTSTGVSDTFPFR